MKKAINEAIEADLVERFVRYVQIYTTSNPQVSTKPSSENQWELLHLLAQELQTMGLKSIQTDPQGFVFATLPATRGFEKLPSFALLAHVDTSPDAPGKDVKPMLHRAYDGHAISLPAGPILDPHDNPLLMKYIGQTIITSDGSTLLGADNKAGVAEIMTTLFWLTTHPEINHPTIEVVFTSDEEIGMGAVGFPFDRLTSRFAYTVDGGEEGSVEYECYHAAMAQVTLKGKAHHPGSARGRLVNAVSMAAAFLNLLPRNESPEATDGRYGCLWANNLQGTVEQTVIDIFIRDFDEAQVQRRLASLTAYGQAMEAAFPGGTISIESKIQYRNMRHKIEEHPFLIERVLQAIRQTGIEPQTPLIRGGTDGARLTEQGLPTPNIFTGGMNFHSRTEWIAVPAMVRAVQTLIELAKLWSSPLPTEEQ